MGLSRLACIRANEACESIVVEHVYREYNGDADGIANEILLDTCNPRLHPDDIVIAEHWL